MFMICKDEAFAIQVCPQRHPELCKVQVCNIIMSVNYKSILVIFLSHADKTSLIMH